jgi:hypothetical protein
MGTKNETKYPTIVKDNDTCTTRQEKAKAFNDFFLTHSQINTKNAKVPSERPSLTRSCLCNIDFKDSEVLDLLKSLDTNKASGPDGVSPRMLKETAEVIYRPLARLIRLSLQTSKYPLDWKKANVIPIFKKGDKSLVGNYRPVSLLSILGKLCERIVFKHVFNYLRDNNVFFKYQSGFMPKDSTVNQLLNIYHVLSKALDDKKDTKMVFCDISKAFDRVWHEGLLYKLENCGINGPLLNWFGCYLSNRQQRVVIQGEASLWGNITAGVPQGSVLGPLLFLLYINDLPDRVKSGMRIFADDTTLYVTVDDTEQIATQQINDDLQNIKEWAEQWLVTFNPAKTKFMHITLKKELSQITEPIFDGQTLTQVNTHKHLGITLSSNLSWSDHISEAVKHAHNRLNMLSFLKYRLGRNTLLTMYQAFIRPILEYGNIVWCNLSNAESDLIESVQRRAGRIISGAIIRTPTNVVYNELGWETLAERRKRNSLLCFHKIVHGTAPKYLQDILPPTVGSGSRYSLRNQGHFSSIKTCTELFKTPFSLQHLKRGTA